eukprot:2590452-Alexandrium_andersonii.AAC.1
MFWSKRPEPYSRLCTTSRASTAGRAAVAVLVLQGSHPGARAARPRAGAAKGAAELRNPRPEP